jgi:chemotaxis methyl-accepting protein methylase
MTTAEHRIWRHFLRLRCGMDFPESRVRYLSQRLFERMRRQNCRSYTEYYLLVAAAARRGDCDGELADLVDLLLNNQSSFFRHPPSFEALAGTVLPELIRVRRATGAETIAMWSAGCAAGQEAYSLAMTYLDRPDSDRWRLKVTGTDIARPALARAERGRYRPSEVRNVGDDRLRAYMAAEEGPAGVSYVVDDRVRALASFGFLNLADPDDYWIAPQDVIFCQNVLIYFDPADRLEVAGRLCDRLKPGGALILGPGEVVCLRRPGIRTAALGGVHVYRRVS